MKKKKGPLILTGVLVLLLILYFALSTWNKKQDSKEEETVKVTDLKTSEITGVKYDLGTGEMNFEKDGDTWYYTADKDFPLRQSYPKTVADAMGQLNADRELEDADALEEYGLDNPTYTVTLTDEDGTDCLRPYSLWLYPAWQQNRQRFLRRQGFEIIDRH